MLLCEATLIFTEKTYMHKRKLTSVTEMSKEARPKWDLLSKDMQVAVEIYKFNLRGEKVWFTKLSKSLDGIIAPSTIHKALNALTDWGVVKVQYGETDKGKAGRLLFIAGEAKNTISQVYEEYWKEREAHKQSSSGS